MSRHALRVAFVAVFLIAAPLIVAQPAGAAVVAGTWSVTTGVDTAAPLTAVSCRSVTRCSAVDLSGNLLVLGASGWSSPQNIDPASGLITLSCTRTNNHCAAADVFGNALTWNGGSWSAPVSLDPGVQIPSVSCRFRSVDDVLLCVAVDQAGNAFTYDGTSWSAAANIDPGGQLTAVSCATVVFCMAVDQAGNGFIYDGSSWSAPFVVEGFSITTISCVSETFCATVDSGGVMLTFNGTGWVGPIGVGVAAQSLSCASPTFSAAVAMTGDAAIYNGTTWSAPVSVDSTGGPYSVSCQTARRCTAVDLAGNALTYYGLAGGTVTLSKSKVIGNMNVTVRGTAWDLDSDTSVDIYECATSTYSPLTCDSANTVHATVLQGLLLGHISGGHITIAVGVIDTNGDTCGLATSPQCFIVVVGSSGDTTSVAPIFLAPTVSISKTTNVAAGYIEHINAKHFPIGDVVSAQQCSPGVTPANLATHCDPATQISEPAGSGGGFLLNPLAVTVRVGTYSDAAAGACIPGGTCYIAVNDTVNAAITTIIPIGLAP